MAGDCKSVYTLGVGLGSVVVKVERNNMGKPIDRKNRTIRRHRTSAGKLAVRHILVPMDFSGYARQALTFAVPLARANRAKISLVHVAQLPVSMRAVPDGGIVMAVDRVQLAAAARRHLDDLADRLLPKQVRGRTIVGEGNAAAGVVAAARRLKADLIVLSNTGRSGLKRLLLGSTAERIVRHAHCPVLTVRRQMNESAQRLLAIQKPLYPSRLPWRRMLVPLDFSPGSLRALKLAVPLAGANGSRLMLLNVVEPNPYASGLEGSVLVESDAVIAKRARGLLTQFARRFVPKSVPTITLVRQGRAVDVIVDTAQEKCVDLIVLSTHGHTGLDRVLMGSTTEQVVRTAKCPVLVVRGL